MKSPPLTIGRSDKIDLPDMQLFAVAAKVDTGAYTSALHCHHVEVREQDGVKVLSFKLLDPSHPEYEDKEYLFRDFEEKSIKSSSGYAERRYIIRTTTQLFGRTFDTEFSLADREQMKFPILLGRKFLRQHFVVDVGKKDLSFKQQNVL